MSKHRQGRINDAVAQELSQAMREAADPRISGSFVSVTRAEVSADLRNARIYFSSFGDDREVLAALKGAAGMFRRRLATTLNLRITPELTFTPDDSIRHGAKIAKILEEIHVDEPTETPEGGGSEG